jgi:hypothetical protein
MNLPHTITTYLQTRATAGPWQLEGCERSGFAGAVVIPALAESGHLPATLRSLAANPPEFLARFLIVVVVNHRADALPADRADNAATLWQLPGWGAACALPNLCWIDAASAGRELPPKGGGVGLARKLGMDLALTRLDYRSGSPLLVCLDADTLVAPTYLPAIWAHFRETDRGGAVIPFRHQPGVSPEEQEAIDRYELFLRGYVLGLELAGSPYAFHTVGSAMACTSAAYVRMGGMNRRAAGEDFYFLQQLHRTARVGSVRGTIIYPASRPSHRVPFGTGRAVGRALAGDEAAVTFYRPECFTLLGSWLRLVEENPAADGTRLLAGAATISSGLADYLEGAAFPGVWDGLRRNHRDDAARAVAFHGWFDALRTMKLIHHLAAGPLPRCGPEESIPPLLDRAGLPQAAGVVAQLELLRTVQNG